MPRFSRRLVVGIRFTIFGHVDLLALWPRCLPPVYCPAIRNNAQIANDFKPRIVPPMVLFPWCGPQIFGFFSSKKHYICTLEHPGLINSQTRACSALNSGKSTLSGISSLQPKPTTPWSEHAGSSTCTEPTERSPTLIIVVKVWRAERHRSMRKRVWGPACSHNKEISSIGNVLHEVPSLSKSPVGRWNHYPCW